MKKEAPSTALTVEQWPIERLVDYARNPRKNDDVVPQMVASFKEFGFRIPIVAKSDGTVVDGHLRLKAARQMGMKTVPVALADDLTDTQVKAFRLLANQSANWAAWDNDLLKLEIEDLKDDGFDVNLIGFDEKTLAQSTTEQEDAEEASEGEDGELSDEGVGYRITYELCFKDEGEQDRWYDYINWLRDKYPDMETITDRILFAAEEYMHHAQ